MVESLQMNGRCHWYEQGKWIRATVTRAIYRRSEGHLVADYNYGSVKGRLDVRGEGDALSGTWDEGKWKGRTQLVHTSDGRKHVFIGTWEGENGPGEFVFDLDEVGDQNK
jgi:hypothetical protein